MAQKKSTHLGPSAQQVQAGLADARMALAQADTRTRAFVRQRPLAALIAAVGIGYFLARVSARV